MVKCCSPARAKAKRAATRKATKMALAGIKPKKTAAKKTHAKKVAAKKVQPCRICGKGKG